MLLRVVSLLVATFGSSVTLRYIGYLDYFVLLCVIRLLGVTLVGEDTLCYFGSLGYFVWLD